MNKSHIRIWPILLAFAAFIALGTPGADAVVVSSLQLSDGANTITISDGDLLLDSNPLPGIVTYLGAVGPQWFVNVTTGKTKPASGTAQYPDMLLGTLDVSSSGAADLTIMFSDVGFSNTLGPLTFDTSVNGGTSGNVTFDSYYSGTNGLFALTNPLSGLGPYGPGLFSGTGSSPANPATYSLTQVAIIHHGGWGLSFLKGEIKAEVAIPEPGTLILLGSGLLGLALAGSRKKFRK